MDRQDGQDSALFILCILFIHVKKRDGEVRA